MIDWSLNLPKERELSPLIVRRVPGVFRAAPKLKTRSSSNYGSTRSSGG